MVKKAAVGRSKSPPLAVKKTVACSGSPKRARKKRCYISTRNKVITFSTGASRTFFTANGGLFVICGFSACLQAGTDGGGGEYPRARSRDISRHTLTHRAKP